MYPKIIHDSPAVICTHRDSAGALKKYLILGYDDFLCTAFRSPLSHSHTHTVSL